MTIEELETRGLRSELEYSATRSSGAGGQNVNKVNTRVELRFDVAASTILNDEEKGMVLTTLASRINMEGELVMSSQTERTQMGNKEKVTLRFIEQIAKALTPRKRRKATRPTLASKKKRVDDKKKLAEKKGRRKDDFQ
ncbi:MAG: aminoacyl-tRNA hydrolase [Bacteroidetes bacterium HGW-Bacteroidetes-22]|nr:MAG: aminoacyl-tRNA hydrolase [Bacteroidetes bacterium HGW-Bacteroidetes-22]